MVGRPAFAENIGSQRTEWLVRARTDGGLEGLTVANRFMQLFHGFDSSDGTVRGLISLLREAFLNRRVDEFLEVSDGRVVGVRDVHRQAGQVAADAAKSYRDGYNGFKIKVGRPGRWMTPEVEVERDAEVVLADRVGQH